MDSINKLAKTQVIEPPPGTRRYREGLTLMKQSTGKILAYFSLWLENSSMVR
jgi:hypothetical protein